MTIRRRLLLGLLAIVLLLAAITGAVEYVVLRNYLGDQAAERLAADLRQAGPLRLIGVAPPDDSGASPATPGHTGPARLTVTAQSAQFAATRMSSRDIAVAVLSSTGQTIATADAGLQLGDPGAVFSVPSGVTPPAAPTAPGQSVIERHEQSVAGRHLLVLADRVLTSGGDTPTFVLATDLAPEDSTLRTVVLVTVAAGLGGLIIAAALAVLVTRRALLPLRRVADTADRIADGDLGERARLPHHRDEVGRLGHAFDRMADRVQSTLDSLREAVANQRRLVHRLRERDAAMRRFVADASHELRTPITAIRGQAQVLARSGVDDPDVRESLAHIQSESERMTRLVNDLLLLSRSDAHVHERALQPLDLAALVRDERGRWEALAPDHRVEVDVTGPTVVDGDGDALLRAISNLVANAAAYSPAGGLIALCVGSVGGGAEVSVRDDGPGIPEADRERVFERFERGGRTRSRSTGGTGLGLAIVRAIAAEHGGDAVVRGAPGGGALVAIRLPLSASGGGDAAAAAAQLAALHGGRPAL